MVENVVDPQARIDALKNLAADNPLVIGVGGEYADAGLTAAPQFPDVEFVVINGETDPAIPNLHAYFVRQGVPAYIAGVVAAELTEAKKVGYLGGELIPPTTQSDDGFKAGVAVQQSRHRVRVDDRRQLQRSRRRRRRPPRRRSTPVPT